jgi:hypothetical protein
LRFVLMRPPETSDHLDTGGTVKKPPRESHPRSANAFRALEPETRYQVSPGSVKGFPY